MIQTTDRQASSDLREKWVHEDNLINHRLTWLLFSQSILFAVYAVLLAAPSNVLRTDEITRFLGLIPIVGFATVIVSALAIQAARQAQKEILMKAPKGCEITCSEPSLSLGHITTHLFPLIFGCAWVYLVLL